MLTIDECVEDVLSVLLHQIINVSEDTAGLVSALDITFVRCSKLTTWSRIISQQVSAKKSWREYRAAGSGKSEEVVGSCQSLNTERGAAVKMEEMCEKMCV